MQNTINKIETFNLAKSNLKILNSKSIYQVNFYKTSYNEVLFFILTQYLLKITFLIINSFYFVFLFNKIKFNSWMYYSYKSYLNNLNNLIFYDINLSIFFNKLDFLYVIDFFFLNNNTLNNNILSNNKSLLIKKKINKYNYKLF